MHYLNGKLSKKTNKESKSIHNKLLKISKTSKSRVYVDTIISPSYTSALAQVIQLSGISGKGNNLILFEFSESNQKEIDSLIQNYNILETTNFDVCVLKTTKNGFKQRKNINIWISSDDYENSNLMILIGYILLGHPDWKNAEIKIYNIEEDDHKNNIEELIHLVNDGRLPISPHNISMIKNEKNQKVKEIINEYYNDADLTIIGFRGQSLKANKKSLFHGYDKLGNIMFVNSQSEKQIID